MKERRLEHERRGDRHQDAPRPDMKKGRLFGGGGPSSFRAPTARMVGAGSFVALGGLADAAERGLLAPESAADGEDPEAEAGDQRA